MTKPYKPTDRPTFEQLEAMLERDEECPIEILPNGGDSSAR